MEGRTKSPLCRQLVRAIKSVNRRTLVSCRQHLTQRRLQQDEVNSRQRHANATWRWWWVRMNGKQEQRENWSHLGRLGKGRKQLFALSRWRTFAYTPWWWEVERTHAGSEIKSFLKDILYNFTLKRRSPNILEPGCLLSRTGKWIKSGRNT